MEENHQKPKTYNLYSQEFKTATRDFFNVLMSEIILSYRFSLWWQKVETVKNKNKNF